MLKKISTLLKQEKTIITNSGFTLAANLVGTAINTLTNFGLSLVLGPVGFGTFKTVCSFFEGLPVDLGLNTTLTRYIPGLELKNALGKIKQLLQTFYLLRIATLALFLGIFFLLRERIAFGLLKESPELNIIYAGMFLFAVNYLDLVRPSVIGFRNYRLYVTSNLLINILRGITALIFAYFCNIPAAIVATALAIIIGNTFNLKFLIKKKLLAVRATPINIRKILINYSLPVYIVSLTSLIGNLTTPLLAIFYPQKTIGHYSFGLMLGSTVALVSGALGQIFFPEVALEYSRNGAQRSQKKLKHVLLIFITACLIIVPAGIAVSPALIRHFAPAYTPAAELVTPLFCLYAIIGGLSLVTSYCVAIGKNKLAAGLNLASSLILFSFSYLILKLGT